jgi:hypothetical protein
MWDIAYVGLALALFGTTLALIRLCERLMEGKR